MTDSRWTVLLRGINVGGRHTVPMAELRDLAASVGLGDRVTYIQSGNLVVDGELDEAALVGTLEPALEGRFGFPIPVVVRSAAELATIAAGHPFAPDRFLLDGREIYLEYPNGSARSKLSHSLLEQRLGVNATIRNWNTITKLVELAGR